MLYTRWREIAGSRPRETALIEACSGRRWTFAELAAAGERFETQSGPAVFPQGNGADFVLLTLAGWRSGRVVCPVESGQAAPDCAGLPADCAHVKLSSATTGTPKVILFSAAQLAADADQIVPTMGLRADWPNLGVISLAHSYGFSNLITPLLLQGVPLILADSPLPEALRRSAALAESITLPAVPALWRSWLEGGAIPANVRLAISAGAPLALALEQAVFAGTGLKIHNFYGASECGGIAYDRTTLPRDDASCVGSPMDGVSVSVADDGCLAVQSPAVGTTYWPEPAPELAQSRYRTSDLAELCGGQVHLRGRAGDLINVAGRKVAPEQIERVLAGHPAVRDCLVFGAPSREPGRFEDVVAVVVSRKETEPGVLRDYLQAQLPAWQIPREWRFMDALVTNTRGKLSRQEWRERYLRGELGSAGRSGQGG